jgi:hypothetical protein
MMCDEYIYNNYKTLLRQYFDKLKVIKLIYYPLLDNDNPILKTDTETEILRKKYVIYPREKYASWISYATNKWKCLKLIKYDKILFMDIDMLPSQPEFYNIFTFNTPCILRKAMKPSVIPKCNEKYTPTPGLNYNDYIVNYLDSNGSLNASLVLLKPSLSLYKKYKKLTNKYFKDGLYGSFLSGPDETSFFYCLSKEGPMYTICYDYARIPWDTDMNWTLDEIKSVYSYDFNSFVKPWIKPRELSWNEELLWHDIYDVLPYNKNLDTIYRSAIKEHFEYYKKLPYNLQKKRYSINKKEISLTKYGILNTQTLEKFIIKQ